VEKKVMKKLIATLAIAMAASQLIAPAFAQEQKPLSGRVAEKGVIKLLSENADQEKANARKMCLAAGRKLVDDHCTEPKLVKVIRDGKEVTEKQFSCTQKCVP
jgi:hypothetical protein